MLDQIARVIGYWFCRRRHTVECLPPKGVRSGCRECLDLAYDLLDDRLYDALAQLASVAYAGGLRGLGDDEAISQAHQKMLANWERSDGDLLQVEQLLEQLEEGPASGE